MAYQLIAGMPRPRSSVWVAGADAMSSKAVQDGGWVDAQVHADSCAGPAEGARWIAAEVGHCSAPGWAISGRAVTQPAGPIRVILAAGEAATQVSDQGR